MLCGNNIGPSAAEGRLLEFFKKLRGRGVVVNTSRGGMSLVVQCQFFRVDKVLDLKSVIS